MARYWSLAADWSLAAEPTSPQRQNCSTTREIRTNDAPAPKTDRRISAHAADSALQAFAMAAQDRLMDQPVSDTSIKEWPRGERPRERLIERGAHTLSDAELLAVLLGTGSAGANALDIARQLLQHFGGSLRRLLTSEADSLLALRGLGPARYATLMASLELARRHYCEALRAGPALNAPAATRQFLTAQLRDRPYEVFCCLHLDNRHRLIHFEEVFRGTIDGASVHPREVVRQALQYNAAALIFAHNHPSGVAEASQADELITRRLRDALALVDIRVLDHLIVGDNSCLSFAERGLL
jgi:DNA repair protein RadC